MPDYASILRRSVSALPEATPEMREAVYQRARAALARQLTAVDPPLSTRDIEAQHQELEDAVIRLEAEFAPADAPEPSFEAPRKDDFFYAPLPSDVQRAPDPPRPAADLRATPRYQEEPAPLAYREDEPVGDDEERRSSRMPAMLIMIALLLVVVGGGAFVYAQRDTLLSFLSQQSATTADVSDTDSGAASEPALAPDDATTKADDRLINGTEPPPAPTEDVAAVLPPPAETPATAAPSESDADAAALDQLSALSGPESTPPEAGTNLVEQRAIYYYQGSQGQPGQASQGSVNWTEITKDGRPAIQAALSIPDRKVTVTVTIYKNYDNTLPASHLVEVQFSGAIATADIQRVPALVLKQTEQARGQPLAGAAVTVTNDLFWIALSSDAEEAARNVQLLREGSWFDIPILFNDQTRALITFEKGIPGDKVFETVMATWTPA